MIDYNGVESILAAGVEHAAQIVSNTKHDDDSVMVDGAEWLTFNGKAVNTIVCNGNSWLGLDGNTENIKVNRRDAAMYNLWREEGTLYGYYHFIKIRWSGYAQYNSAAGSYLITYDVILFDNGVILLSLVDIPSTYYNGVFELFAGTSYPYAAPMADAPCVSFYRKEDGTYTIGYEVAVIPPPFDRKYLVYSRGTYYNVQNGVLHPLGITEATAQSFREYGSDEMPSVEILTPLGAFDVLFWYDSDVARPSMRAELAAVPDQQQIVTDEIDLSDPSITGIASAVVVCEGNPLFAVSFGGSWKMHNGQKWTDVSGSTSGMSAQALAAITTAQWNEQAAGKSAIRLRCVLSDVTDKVTSVYFKFVN